MLLWLTNQHTRAFQLTLPTYYHIPCTLKVADQLGCLRLLSWSLSTPMSQLTLKKTVLLWGMEPLPSASERSGKVQQGRHLPRSPMW